MEEKEYIISFSKREQYNCDGDCTKRAVAKSFGENTTLHEVVEWVKKEAGPFCNEINLLSNPEILGIENR